MGQCLFHTTWDNVPSVSIRKRYNRSLQNCCTLTTIFIIWLGCRIQGLATSDHTTLLLNCYTKLKDVSKLDEFLRRGAEGDQPTLNFDVDIAVKVHACTEQQLDMSLIFRAGTPRGNPRCCSVSLWFVTLLPESPK